jgi:hypothetical protein
VLCFHYDKNKIFPNYHYIWEAEYCLSKTCSGLLGWQNQVTTCPPQVTEQHLGDIIIIVLYQGQIVMKMYLDMLSAPVMRLNCSVASNKLVNKLFKP